MKKQLASAMTTLAVGLLVWATTTSLQLLDPAWRIGIAFVVALGAGFCVYLLLRSSQERKKQQQILSDIKAGGDVTLNNIDVGNLETKSVSVASNIRAGRNASFRDIRIGKGTSQQKNNPTSELPAPGGTPNDNSDQIT